MIKKILAILLGNKGDIDANLFPLTLCLFRTHMWYSGVLIKKIIPRAWKHVWVSACTMSTDYLDYRWA